MVEGGTPPPTVYGRRRSIRIHPASKGRAANSTHSARDSSHAHATHPFSHAEKNRGAKRTRRPSNKTEQVTFDIKQENNCVTERYI